MVIDGCLLGWKYNQPIRPWYVGFQSRKKCHNNDSKYGWDRRSNEVETKCNTISLPSYWAISAPALIKGKAGDVLHFSCCQQIPRKDQNQQLIYLTNRHCSQSLMSFLCATTFNLCPKTIKTRQWDTLLHLLTCSMFHPAVVHTP